VTEILYETDEGVEQIINYMEKNGFLKLEPVIRDFGRVIKVRLTEKGKKYVKQILG